MPNIFEPRIAQWYSHTDKGQRFFVTAIDEKDATIEVQHFDGDIEEFTDEEWRELDIELSEAPESWSGPLDIVEQDDFGTEITDTQYEDWNQPGQDFQTPDQDTLAQDPTSFLGAPVQGLAPGIDTLVKRTDGKYEERLSDDWMAEYLEEPETGLWQVEVFKHDVSEWRTSGYMSIEEARQSAEEYYNQA